MMAASLPKDEEWVQGTALEAATPPAKSWGMLVYAPQKSMPKPVHCQRGQKVLVYSYSYLFSFEAALQV